MTATQAIRTFLFYLLLSSSAFLWGTLSFFVAPFLPLHRRYRFVVQTWCRFAVWLARHLVQIDYRVSGLENIPQGPCVVLAKHQSTWETFFLSALFSPLSQVLKRELLYVPFFGWALALLKPIAINRSQPKVALKQVAGQGADRLRQGFSILIFPEGTRIPPGEIGKFSRGGAALAAQAGLPVLPIALNSGRFWPKHGWAKQPGTIDVIIGQPLLADDSSSRAVARLNEQALAWITEQQQRIDQPPASPATEVCG